MPRIAGHTLFCPVLTIARRSIQKRVLYTHVMAFDEFRIFGSAFRGDRIGVGAVLPTSRFAAQALCAEVARDPRPKHILEAGAGTGAVTAELVKLLGPQDRLTIVELNPELAAYLRGRFETDPEFARVREQSQVLEIGVEQLEGHGLFDYIVSAIPFSNLPPEIVASILMRYQALLRRGGALSFIEYAYGRAAKQLGAQLAQDAGLLTRTRAVDQIVVAQAEAYEFRRDTILRNVPPAWIRHWRFEAAPVADAVSLLPRDRAQRVALGGHGFDSDAVPWLAGLGGLAWIARKRAPALSALAVLAGVGAAVFMRDPKRTPASGAGLVCSACDGEVTEIETIDDARFGAPGEWLRIVCFLSLADVHINRAPIAGRVVDVLHEEGGYAPAMQSGAEQNASVYTVIEDPHGERVVVAQRVGAMARRIVNRCRRDDLLAKGEKIGLIRFGSRTDVYLPAARYKALVQPGDRVRAGETPIAAVS
jgi:phosphatidylserine decarboxylase